jgi:hypothetical protein
MGVKSNFVMPKNTPKLYDRAEYIQIVIYEDKNENFLGQLIVDGEPKHYTDAYDNYSSAIGHAAMLCGQYKDVGRAKVYRMKLDNGAINL